MLLLLRRGRITIPPAADPAAYILSDGRLLQDSESKLETLAELTSAFQANRIAGHKEASTLKTENIHIRHLLRILKGNTFAQAIGYTQVQGYAAKRLGELVGGKHPVSTETVRKEVATFRVIWNWALKQGLLEGAAPVAGLEYPKRDEKPPFMTWDKIEHIIERDGLNPVDTKRYWECLYLRSHEVQEALVYLKSHGVHAYLYRTCQSDANPGPVLRIAPFGDPTMPTRAKGSLLRWKLSLRNSYSKRVMKLFSDRPC